MRSYDSDRETEAYDRETFPGEACPECGAEEGEPHAVDCGEQALDVVMDELKALAAED